MDYIPINPTPSAVWDWDLDPNDGDFQWAREVIFGATEAGAHDTGETEQDRADAAAARLLELSD